MRLRRGKDIVLVISDTQAPFAHKDAIAFLGAVKTKYRPTKIVAIGDTLDQHTLGRFVHDPDGMGPKDEYERAMVWMKELYGLFPKAVETTSNHNARYMKRAKEAGLPSFFLKRYEDIMQFPPGWKSVDNVEIDGVMYEHGTRFGGTGAARQAVSVNGQSTVFGHLHSGGSVVYVANNKHMYFGMNCGCLIDYDAYAFSYAKDAKFRPTLGCGLVDRGVPHFIPMLIDSAGKWLGEL